MRTLPLSPEIQRAFGYKYAYLTASYIAGQSDIREKNVIIHPAATLNISKQSTENGEN